MTPTAISREPLSMAPEGKQMTEEAKSLGEALPNEMARVRDVVLPAYLSIGPSGGFAAAMMRRDLDFAAKAMAEGDVVAMIRAFQELKGWEL